MLAVVSLCCFAMVSISISDVRNYVVEVCAESERKAVEEATAQCLRNAGRRCRCACEKTGMTCNGSNVLWRCSCSRLINDNW
jgi:hypothetical protein